MRGAPPVTTRASRDGRVEAKEFEAIAAELVPALRLHCYRIVGSLEDAEDMVQESLARAWGHAAELDDRRSLRAWLYRIATNACLDLLDRRRRETAASGRSIDAPDPDPYPDGWLEDIVDPRDPEDGFIRRETVTLAFVAAVQRLPPRQRAILILRDVLEWRAVEVADALGTTVPAVNSALQRAHASLRDRLHDGRHESVRPRLDDADAVARRYLRAWEATDIAALTELLVEDARMAMPPDPREFVGRDAIIEFLATSIFARAPEHRIRIVPTAANHQPAFVLWERDTTTGEDHPIGVKVLSVSGSRIVEIRGYMGVGLAKRFTRLR